MALSKDVIQAAEEGRAELHAQTPEENRRTAGFIREAARVLTSARPRRVA